MKSTRGFVSKTVGMIVCVFLLSVPYMAWAQTIVGPRDQHEETLWIRGLFFGAGVLVGYGIMFHLVFPALLWQGTRPLAAYAWSWCLWFWIASLLVLLAFSNELIPGHVPPTAPFWDRHKLHVFIVILGFSLSMCPFFLLRRSRNI